MAIHDNDILVITDPTIELLKLELADTDDLETINPNANNVEVAKFAGTVYPVMSINGATFEGSNIVSCVVFMDDIIPHITFSIQDNSGLFTTSTYPKDGDICMLYMRSKNKDFKPIRIDFKITDVKSSELDKNNSNSLRKSHRIEGIMHIPEFHNEGFESFGGMTCFETMNKISDFLKLGFCSNIKMTNDKMTRIRSAQTYSSFINEIVKTAYKDDQSFFTAFVDQYYFLNLVELNSRFVIDKEVETSTIASVIAGDWQKNSSDLGNKEFPLLLTNHPNSTSTPTYLNSFVPFNDTGNVWLKYGYRNNIMYYDKDTKDKTQYFIETLNTDGGSNMKILKGNDKENTTGFQRYNYLGPQSKDNVHSNYMHAAMNNRVNIEEIQKMGLDVEINSFNPNIYRFQILPVLIFLPKYGSEHVQQVEKYPRDDDYGLVYDPELSGYYVVSELKYVYTNSSNYIIKARLLRREWANTLADRAASES